MYDDAVLKCFLDAQGQLFPEPVADNMDEAREFLEEVMAVVVSSESEVADYFEEEGMDIGEGGVLEAAEVFDVGDGRYLIVEA